MSNILVKATAAQRQDCMRCKDSIAVFALYSCYHKALCGTCVSKLRNFCVMVGEFFICKLIASTYAGLFAAMNAQIITKAVTSLSKLTLPMTDPAGSMIASAVVSGRYKWCFTVTTPSCLFGDRIPIEVGVISSYSLLMSHIVFTTLPVNLTNT